MLPWLRGARDAFLHRDRSSDDATAAGWLMLRVVCCVVVVVLAGLPVGVLAQQFPPQDYGALVLTTMVHGTPASIAGGRNGA